MKKNDAETATRMAIGVAVDKNRDAVIALFKKHGVNISSSYTNQELIVGILQAMKSNSRFKDDLAKLLASTAMEHKSNFAEGNFCFDGLPGEVTGADPVYPNTTPAVKKTGALSGVFNSTNLSNLFNTGLTTLSNSLTNKSNQKLAQTALEIEQQKTQQAALLASAGGAGAAAKPGMSTGAKVGIGLGIAAVVGTIVYLLVRKRKK